MIGANSEYVANGKQNTNYFPQMIQIAKQQVVALQFYSQYFNIFWSNLAKTRTTIEFNSIITR